MWSRPAGEPHVWRCIELTDTNGKKRKFSLQEIPEDRYDEVVDFFLKIFIRDEITCASLDVVNDPDSVALCKGMWDSIVRQGISVVAYEVFDDNSRPILAASNMLAYVDAKTDEATKTLGTGTTKADTVLRFIMGCGMSVDPRATHGVDKYLGGLGLNTHPEYRKLGLGQQLLEIRDDIGKTYDIEYTSTCFTSTTSQAIAEKAGFKTVLEIPYDDIVGPDGKLAFEKCSGKSVKIMEKKLKN